MIADQGRCGAFFKRLAHKIMPIAGIFERNKDITGLKRARINRYTMRRP
jgi:hypothetical protein